MKTLMRAILTVLAGAAALCVAVWILVWFVKGIAEGAIGK